jgi:toxin secretion/phage lysis holin
LKDVLVKGPVTAFTAFLSYLLGIVNELVVILLFFMALDMFTGLMRGLLTRSLNSTIGLQGIFKKVTMLIVIGVSAGIEFALMQTGLETNALITIAVTCFFIVNEGLSILENSAQMGVPIPAILTDALEKLQLKGGKEQKVIRKKAK